MRERNELRLGPVHKKFLICLQRKAFYKGGYLDFYRFFLYIQAAIRPWIILVRYSTLLVYMPDMVFICVHPSD